MEKSSPTTLSLAESFERDGYISPIQVLSADEAMYYRQKLEQVFSQIQPPTTSLRQIHLHLPWAYDLLFRKEITDPIASILGTEVLMRGLMVLVKPPHSNGIVLWHSDQAYKEKSDAPQLSAWLALSPSFPENGCMKVVPGSHHEIHAHHEVPSPTHQLNQTLTVLQAPEPSSIVNLQLDPGFMSLHHPLILHGSDANHTDIPRIGFIMRMVTPEYPPHNVATVRISGQKPCPHFNLVQPVFANDEATRISNAIAFNQQYIVHEHN